MTNITEVIDLFMLLQNDYRLNAIYTASGSTVFTNYLEGWLLYSVNEFTPVCNQDLTYDSTTQNFSETLTQENIMLLAQIMVKYWLMKEVQDVLQMNNNIQDHDFKTYSQAQNLKEKKDLLNAKREEIAQLLVDYGYRHNNWTEWGSQNFGGG